MIEDKHPEPAHGAAATESARSGTEPSMTPERWERAKELFHEAQQLDPVDRAAFLDRECQGDPEMRHEVESLHSADGHAQDENFMDKPALAGTESTQSDETRPGAPKVGQLLSQRFLIIRRIGHGGMGEVYEAEDRKVGERIALKTIKPENAFQPRALDRFLREFKLALRVTHPNVCRLRHFDTHEVPPGDPSGNIAFVTMDLLEGETLAARLRRVGRMTTADALPLVQQMAEALAAAHDAGVIHRDFKPGNVMLVPPKSATGKERAVVTDFGLAKAFATSDRPVDENLLSLSEHFAGTPAYMAPEQLMDREVTPATDIYALGIVMYEIVTGERPFKGSYQRFVPPTPRVYITDLDPRWESAIMPCLEIDPAKRFGGAREIVAALRGETETKPPPPKPQLRLLMGLAVAAAAVLITVALLIEFSRLYALRRGTDLKLAPGATLLLAGVANNTGEADLDGASELLRSQLAQSAHFNLMEKARIREVLERMARSPDQKLDATTAREVALRAHVPCVVFGDLSRPGENYSLDVEIDKPDTEPARARATWGNHWTAPNKQDLFAVIREASDWIRKTAGEAAADLNDASYDRRPEDITTDSWESLSLYSKGEELKAQMKLDQAILLYREAIEKDPQFATAYMRLGDVLLTLHRSREGYEYWQKALEASAKGPRHLTPKEELRIRGEFAMDRWDFGDAVREFQTYAVQFPNDYLGFFMRAPSLVMLYESPDTAIGALLEAERRPNAASGSFYIQSHFARYYLIAGDLPKAFARIARLRQAGLNDYADALEGEARFLEGNYQRADELFGGLRKYDNVYLRSASYCLQANLRAELGQYTQALKLLAEGMRSDALADLKVQQAGKVVATSYLYYMQGSRSASRDAALEAIRLDFSLERSLTVGTLLARSGYPADAEDVLKNLDPTRYAPVSDIVRWRLRGEILMARDKACDALAEFEKADQKEAPAHGRDYLARAELACTGPSRPRSRDQEAAFSAYKAMALNPGRLWYQGEDTLPGFWADMLFRYSELGTRVGDHDGQAALDRYLKLRYQSDPDLPDFRKAKELKGRMGKHPMEAGELGS